MAQDITKQDLVAPEETSVMRDIVEEVHGYVEDYKDRERTILQKMFPDRQRSAYQHLDTINIEPLRERQQRLIENIADGYYVTVEKLIKSFQRILDEEIHDTRAPRSAPAFEE